MVRNFTSVTKVYDIIDNTTFVSYRVVENNITMNVPLDSANTDYQDIQAWIAAGNSVVDPNDE